MTGTPQIRQQLGGDTQVVHLMRHGAGCSLIRQGLSTRKEAHHFPLGRLGRAALYKSGMPVLGYMPHRMANSPEMV
jgi:hypothetical protein